MNELELKYGCNPNQKPARVFMEQGELPFQVLCGKPGYINLLDALNGCSWLRNSRRQPPFRRRPPLSMFLRPVQRSDAAFRYLKKDLFC